MNDIAVGIVGLGWAAGAHIEALKSTRHARLAAICTRQNLDATTIEKIYGVTVKVFNTYEAMLADESLDVVDICTPHHLHFAQAIAAVNAKKHLILEKPVCLNYDDLLVLRNAIERAGCHVSVCFECRHSQQFNLIRSCLDQGLLGTIHYGEVDYFHGLGPWYGQFAWNIKKTFGGSSLLTAGCHALDGLLYFLGSPVEEVMAYATRSQSSVFDKYEYQTTSVTIMKCVDGRIGKVASVIDCLQPYYFHVNLIGSEGSLLDNKIYSARLKGLTKARWSVLETALIDSGDVKDHPYLPQFQAFFDGLRAGRRTPESDFQSAFETHRVIFAAEQSIQNGRPVRMEELTPGRP
jgi:predicted dehydrogenase